MGYTVLGWKVTDLDREVQRLTKKGVKFSFYEGLNQNKTACGLRHPEQRSLGLRTPITISSR